MTIIVAISLDKQRRNVQTSRSTGNWQITRKTATNRTGREKKKPLHLKFLPRTRGRHPRDVQRFNCQNWRIHLFDVADNCLWTCRSNSDSADSILNRTDSFVI